MAIVTLGAWFALACSVADAGRQSKDEAPFGRTQVDSAFWTTWGDGKAELDSYVLTQPRYGEQRRGSAVWIFVTETFTEAQRVKSDGGHPDEFPVLKHNDVRHFQTGIYDYDVVTSTFLRLDGRDPLGVPTKVSMGMQEWCGHVYTQAVTEPGALAWTSHSYFDGEGDQAERLDRPATAVLLDTLPTVARGIGGLWPAPGAEAEVVVLDGLARLRYAHEAPRFSPATLARHAEVESVRVPAGTFDATRVTLTRTQGVSYTWWVEAAEPFRIVSWSTSDGERGELVATVRVPYWQLNGELETRWLAELGLAETPLPEAP